MSTKELNFLLEYPHHISRDAHFPQPHKNDLNYIYLVKESRFHVYQPFDASYLSPLLWKTKPFELWNIISFFVYNKIRSSKKK